MLPGGDKMKVGDLIRRRFVTLAQKRRMMGFDPAFDPDALYIVTKIDDDLGGAQILNTATGNVETVVNSTDYYEVISETR
tara:strand:- start:243 stop:482 length:240 start_codon:yes stop_codon:yes gene_type:complete